MGKRKPELQETTVEAEKERSLKIYKKIKTGEINLEGAVKEQIANENTEQNLKNQAGKASKRRSKMGGRKRGRSEHKAAAVLAKKGAGGRGGRARKNKGAAAKGKTWNNAKAKGPS